MAMRLPPVARRPAGLRGTVQSGATAITP